MKVNNKVLIYGLFIPLLFVLLEVYVLGIEFNLIELVILIYITISTILIYGQNNDYLNPMVYFPILYFAYYWIGNFDMGYPKVPRSMWLLYGLGLLGFYFGGFLAKNVKVYNPKIMKKDYLSKGARYIFYAIYIVCIIAKAFIYCKNGIPIFSEKIDVIRQTASESFGAVKIIAGIHTILAVYFFYDIIIRKKDKKKIFILDIVCILSSFIIAVLDTSRLLIIQMIIPMIFIYIIKIRRISLKTNGICAFFLLIFISVNKFVRNILSDPLYLTYIASRNNTLFENIMLSGFDSFRVGIDDLRQIIGIVPSSSPYTYGKMFFNSVFSFLPGKQTVIGYYVADLLNLKFDGIGAASTILGMFYLDGGIPMIFIGMMLFGFFVQYNYLKYIKYKNLTVYSLIAVYITYYSILCLRTNVMPTIEPIINMISFWGLSYIAQHVRLKY